MQKNLTKVASGIPGFDEIAHGGLPKGRSTLVSGPSGSGKTIFCAEFLYHGITASRENGVFVTFEERPEDIIKNMAGFGWDLSKLTREKKLVVVDISPPRVEKVVAGSYDLSGMLARIEHAVKQVGAKRVAVDSVSALFSYFDNPGVIRHDLYRLCERFRELGVTSIISAERPKEDDEVSRYGVEEFVSDNVVLLHNRLGESGMRERTVEILKFRGSPHDSEEAPLIVSNRGITVYPRPKPELTGRGFAQKVSTGVDGLDHLLFGGVFKGSTTLLTGASGTGKTVSCLHFILEGAKRKETSLMIEFEESAGQLYRNASSFGWPLKRHVEQGRVYLTCSYPENMRPEQYLKIIEDLVVSKRVKRLALDSLSALQRIYTDDKFREFVVGLCAILKMHGVTTILTNTTNQLLGVTEITETHLSTATDNIVILKYVEIDGEMRRLVNVLKQRGSKHRKELVEFAVGQQGVQILGPFRGIENLMSGSAQKIALDFDKGDAEREFVSASKSGKL